MGINTNVGLVEISATDYHANTEAIGHSGLVKILRSPAHYRESVINPSAPSEAMELGTAFHTALLEPELFASDYAVLDESKFADCLVSLDDYKAAAAALEITVGKMKKEELKQAIAARNDPRFKFREDVMAELYGGKTILSCDDMHSISSMCANIRSHRGAANLLSRGQAELSGFWIDQETGLLCKMRMDWLAWDENQRPIGIADAKKAREAGSREFAKAIANFGYDIQAALYTDGLKAITGYTVPFYFIPAENTAPFAACCYKADEGMIETGRAKYRAALQLLKWCRENNEWPAYQPYGDIESISLPRWASADFESE